jgi:hypothetical protein
MKYQTVKFADDADKAKLQGAMLGWPDMSAYGVEIVNGWFPKETFGEQFVFVTVIAADGTPDEDYPDLLARLAPKLERVGFRRHDAGAWIRDDMFLSQEPLLAEFPQAVFRQRPMLDLIIDLRTPAEEPSASPAP